MPFDPPEIAQEAFVAYLGSIDVLLGRPQEREALAVRLVENGFTVSDIKTLELVTVGRKDPAAALVTELKDLKTARMRIDDVRKCELAKRSSGNQAGAVHVADEACNQRKAYALVVVDGKGVALVADLMGVSTHKVRDWVETEKQLRAYDRPAKWKRPEEDTRTPAEKLEAFRQFLVARKEELAKKR